MHFQGLKASHIVFSSAVWMLFALCLWRMDFSLSDMIRFGQQISDRANLTGSQELMQSGFLP
ncbi:hypothetical protein GFS31_04920 [Leptolyngbya sp. BL0902]|uniref:hypothetical protein n=1 Tax=Leptolyngbya sp. BL0902 TaxID=1115757 RepID=UPI0018E812DA|nr:hypothetical protein [Leptolyngbya sp. BL0902]QQE63822.1 hypothetical protein GFS31_04920 [Leptolyngbya sp. BL0902]